MHGRLHKLVIASMALVVLGGCTTLGPDFSVPKVTSLDQWQPSAETKVDQGAVKSDLDFWWQLFEDPALNLLVDEIRRENLSLQIAGLRIYESQALLGIAASSQYPQVKQATGALNYVNTKGHNGALPLDRQSSVAYQAGFNLGWELDFWGRFQRAIESADAAYLASVAAQQDAQVLLTAQVVDLYFAYRVTETRIAIAHKNAKIQKRSFEITERLFKGGEESELDFQQAKSQYLATLSSIPELEITLLRTRNSLNALLGRAPGPIAELQQQDYRLPVINTIALAEVPAQLLMRRPDIQVAAAQIAAQSAQIGIAEADYYPAISLMGAIGWSGSTLSGNPYTDSLGVGPAVKWNIFDQGQIANNIRVQDARLQQLIAQYQNVVLQAAREIDDAGYSVIKTAEQGVLITESYKAADRALDIANTRYREGYADFQRVLDAQRALFTQEERQLLNQGAHLSSVIALYKGLGGGWSETAHDQLVPENVRETMKARSDWGSLLDPPESNTPDEP